MLRWQYPRVIAGQSCTIAAGNILKQYNCLRNGATHDHAVGCLSATIMTGLLFISGGIYRQLCMPKCGWQKPFLTLTAALLVIINVLSLANVRLVYQMILHGRAAQPDIRGRLLQVCANSFETHRSSNSDCVCMGREELCGSGQ